MVHRLSSPPLIKGIDGIVSRSPNEVNYSTLMEKNMESRNHQETKYDENSKNTDCDRRKDM